MSNARVDSFAIDSNNEVMPNINECDDRIVQAIDDQLHNVENAIVDDDNNVEHAVKCQRINNNDASINHFNYRNEVDNESPNENDTSTNENNSAQGGVASSSLSSNAACKTTCRMSCREYYNKNNKNKKILICMCLGLKDEDDNPMDYEIYSIYKNTKAGRKHFIPEKKDLQNEVMRRSFLHLGKVQMCKT